MMVVCKLVSYSHCYIILYYNKASNVLVFGDVLGEFVCKLSDLATVSTAKHVGAKDKLIRPYLDGHAIVACTAAFADPCGDRGIRGQVGLDKLSQVGHRIIHNVYAADVYSTGFIMFDVLSGICSWSWLDRNGLHDAVRDMVDIRDTVYFSDMERNILANDPDNYDLAIAARMSLAQDNTLRPSIAAIYDVACKLPGIELCPWDVSLDIVHIPDVVSPHVQAGITWFRNREVSISLYIPYM